MIKMIHGRGVYAKINEKIVLAGNEKMLEESQIILPAEQKEADVGACNHRYFKSGRRCTGT